MTPTDTPTSPPPRVIWAVQHETYGAMRIGEWADSIRHLGGEEYHHHSTVEALTARAERAEAAIARQAGAAKTLRELTLAEVQHLKDQDRSEYVAAHTLDSERQANAQLTEEIADLTTRAEAAEAELGRALAQIEDLDLAADRAHARTAAEIDAIGIAAFEAVADWHHHEGRRLPADDVPDAIRALVPAELRPTAQERRIADLTAALERLIAEVAHREISQASDNWGMQVTEAGMTRQGIWSDELVAARAALNGAQPAAVPPPPRGCGA